MTNLSGGGSCVDGTSPSTPPPCFSSNKEAAKARATAQLKMAPHLILHACSARLLRMGGSDLAFALAKRDKNLPSRPPIFSCQNDKANPATWAPQGTSAPSIVWLPPEQHHPHLPHVDEGTRYSAMETPVSCRLPTGLLQRAAAHQPRSPIFADPWGWVPPSRTHATWHLQQPFLHLHGRSEHLHSPLRSPAFPTHPLWHMQLCGGQRRREDGHNDTDV